MGYWLIVCSCWKQKVIKVLFDRTSHIRTTFEAKTKTKMVKPKLFFFSRKKPKPPKRGFFRLNHF